MERASDLRYAGGVYVTSGDIQAHYCAGAVSLADVACAELACVEVVLKHSLLCCSAPHIATHGARVAWGWGI